MNCGKINILDGEARRRGREATRWVPRRHFCPLPSWESQQELSCQESGWGCKTMLPSVPRPHFLILGILTKEGTLNQIIMLCQPFMLFRNICLRNHTLGGGWVTGVWPRIGWEDLLMLKENWSFSYWKGADPGPPAVAWLRWCWSALLAP